MIPMNSLACLQKRKKKSSYNFIKSLESITNLQEIQRKLLTLNHDDAITKIHIMGKYTGVNFFNGYKLQGEKRRCRGEQSLKKELKT